MHYCRCSCWQHNCCCYYSAMKRCEVPLQNCCSTWTSQLKIQQQYTGYTRCTASKKNVIDHLQMTYVYHTAKHVLFTHAHQGNPNPQESSACMQLHLECTLDIYSIVAKNTAISSTNCKYLNCLHPSTYNTFQITLCYLLHV